MQLPSIGACGNVRCKRCNWVGHATKDCRVNVPPKEGNVNPPQQNVGNKRNCFECGSPGHFRKDCPKLKPGGNNARGRAFMMGAEEARQDPNHVTVRSSLIINMPQFYSIRDQTKALYQLSSVHNLMLYQWHWITISPSSWQMVS